MFDIIFCFIVMYVRSLNYISAAINMFKVGVKSILRIKHRALDSFFPLVALVRLTFSVGRTSTSFGRNFYFLFFLIQHLINQCMLINFYHSL